MPRSNRATQRAVRLPCGLWDQTSATDSAIRNRMAVPLRPHAPCELTWAVGGNDWRRRFCTLCFKPPFTLQSRRYRMRGDWQDKGIDFRRCDASSQVHAEVVRLKLNPRKRNSSISELQKMKGEQRVNETVAGATITSTTCMYPATQQ